MIILNNGHSRRPVNLFFIEIIIALLFFSVSGAVIMKVFAAADSKTRESALLEKAIITAQSVAELYSCSGDAHSAVCEAVGAGSVPDLSAVPLEDGRAVLSVSERREPSGAGELRRLSMSFSANGKEIYTLECSAYIGGGGSDE